LAFGWNFLLNITFFPAFLLLDEARCGCMPCCGSHEKQRSEFEVVDQTESETKGKQSELSVAERVFADVITPALSHSTAVQAFILFFLLLTSLLLLLYGIGIPVGLKVTDVRASEASEL